MWINKKNFLIFNKKKGGDIMKKQKGFTLIELLVVIAIIGLLSTLAVIALNNARAKSRDARRVSDIKQLQSALELYYNDRNGYPAGTDADVGNDCLSSAGFESSCTGDPIYMTKVPKNPSPGGIDYIYNNTDGTAARKYSIQYTLEGSAGGVDSGSNTATQAGLWGG